MLKLILSTYDWLQADVETYPEHDWLQSVLKLILSTFDWLQADVENYPEYDWLQAVSSSLTGLGFYSTGWISGAMMPFSTMHPPVPSVMATSVSDNCPS